MTRKNRNEDLWRLAGRLLLEARRKLNRAREFPVGLSTHMEIWMDGIATKGAAQRMLGYLREPR